MGNRRKDHMFFTEQMLSFFLPLFPSEAKLKRRVRVLFLVGTSPSTERMNESCRAVPSLSHLPDSGARFGPERRDPIGSDMYSHFCGVGAGGKRRSREINIRAR